MKSAVSSIGQETPCRPMSTRARHRRVVANVVASAAVVTVGVFTGPGLLFGLIIAAAIGVSCEILAPLHEGRRSTRAYMTDLTHAIGNRCIIVPLVVVALSLVGPLVNPAVLSSVREGFGGLPWLAQLAVMLVTTDFTNYLAHRSRCRSQGWPSPLCANDRSVDLFVSYTSSDRTWAEWIAWQLEAQTLASSRTLPAVDRGSGFSGGDGSHAAVYQAEGREAQTTWQYLGSSS